MSDCCSISAADIPSPPALACRSCGNRSKQVDTVTVKSLVRRLPFGMPQTQYYFCDAPGCDVVYFASHPDAPSFKQSDLSVRVGAKETEHPIPVCYCFGFSRMDIQDEIAETGRSTLAPRVTAEVKAGNCACEVKNPSGKCCLGDIARAAQGAIRALKEAGIAR